MAFGAKEVKTIGVLVLGLVLLAGIGTLLVPLLLGIGASAGSALSVDTTTAYNESLYALENVTEAEGSVFSFLPWLGVGLVVMAALGIRKIM